MFRSLNSARRSARDKLIWALAAGAAMTAVAITGTALTAVPAAAQDEIKRDYSQDFVAVYQPLADAVNADSADIATLRGQFPGLLSAAQTPDDQFAAGNLILAAGTKASDEQLQRHGLEVMVASGRVEPERLGQIHYSIAGRAFNAKDYTAARASLEAAQAAGYSAPDADIPGLIAESYFAGGDNAGGIAYVTQESEKRRAAGQQVPERWLLRALQSAYDDEQADQALRISNELLVSYPTERNWMNSLQILYQLKEFTPQQQLDLLRLMRETGTLSQRAEFVTYIEAADPRVMSNEVSDVLASGLAAGQFDTGDTYYTEVKSIVDQRAPQDRSNAPTMIREANSQSDPRYASEAGDVLFSLDDFAQAEAMYQLALDKGHPDRDEMLTRIGIAQAKQGKFAEAQGNFEQVGGQRAPIAQMWSLYTQSRGQTAMPAQGG